MARISDRFVSHGHADHFDAVVWSNAAGTGTPVDAGALDDAGAVFDAGVVDDAKAADGAVWIEEAIDPGAPGERLAGFLVMERRDGAWQFATATPDGRKVMQPARSACATCHSDAPSGVFSWGAPKSFNP
jgi:mono/diheme cytochrome c family protein